MGLLCELNCFSCDITRVTCRIAGHKDRAFACVRGKHYCSGVSYYQFIQIKEMSVSRSKLLLNSVIKVNLGSSNTLNWKI